MCLHQASHNRVPWDQCPQASPRHPLLSTFLFKGQTQPHHLKLPPPAWCRAGIRLSITQCLVGATAGLEPSPPPSTEAPEGGEALQRPARCPSGLTAQLPGRGFHLVLSKCPRLRFTLCFCHQASPLRPS